MRAARWADFRRWLRTFVSSASGVFEGVRLVAKARERFEASRLREISAVCAHPDYQGRGLARRLVQHLIRRERERNQTPFLHVMNDHERARRLYERRGFRHFQEMAVRIVSRTDKGLPAGQP